MIDVHRLRVLREVARHGSFNRAAVALRMTASAVSQQIAALERSVGTPVVARSTRGVRLTDAGLILTETADAVTAELDRAVHDLARLSGDADRHLAVATFTSGGQRLLPPALGRFHREHPDVLLNVVEADTEESLPRVSTGEADLAIAYHFDGPPPSVPGLAWTPLLDDPMWVVLPSGHPMAGRDTVTLGELAEERWILGCVGLDDMLGQHAALAGFAPVIACRSTDYVFAQSMVRAGIGISLVPQVALAADRGGLSVVPLMGPGPIRYVGVATPRRRVRPVAAALLRALQETVAGLPVA
ncbi:LysR family transcriptional regulator [Catenuloplanes atrovinosus]|uniref:Molybdate transport repressor ModE-like protein n=1 Tax=Catenuloplanes atrovinosus TaxID=137266 RepID=A0AAE4CAC1_9ACTN|nr:LysR substrate-binding domain-containing protein [Catenuloplanes atrovinosus]MDR7274470.1 molybdate transport repressor ModE-like protein [Catenuloplanes atrovinosus]